MDLKAKFPLCKCVFVYEVFYHLHILLHRSDRMKLEMLHDYLSLSVVISLEQECFDLLLCDFVLIQLYPNRAFFEFNYLSIYTSELRRCHIDRLVLILFTEYLSHRMNYLLHTMSISSILVLAPDFLLQS